MSWWVGEKGVGGLGVVYGVGERYGEEQRSCLQEEENEREQH
jgi:hypothetical protein